MRSLVIHNRLSNVAIANRTIFTDRAEMLGVLKAVGDLTKLVTDEEVGSDIAYGSVLKLFALSGGNILCDNNLVLPSVEEKGTIRLGEGITSIVTKSVSGKSAIKEIVLSDIASLSSFVKEVAALRCCSHPNIVRIEAFGVGLVGDDLVAKIQLPVYTSNLESISLEEDETYRIGMQLVGALGYLHKTLGILHNDIKPSNIFYDYATKGVVLADFGVMTLYNGEDVELPCPAGTYIYSPPSILRSLVDGQPVVVSPATDRWMLGVSLHEVVYGLDSWLSDVSMQAHREVRILEELESAKPGMSLDDIEANYPAEYETAVAKMGDKWLGKSLLIVINILRKMLLLSPIHNFGNLSLPFSTSNIY